MMCRDELEKWVTTVLDDLNASKQVSRIWLCTLRAMRLTLATGSYRV